MTKIITFIFLLIASFNLAVRPNPLYDIDPSTAPFVAEHLDYSATTLRSIGGQETIFDVTPPFSNDAVGPNDFIQTMENIIDPTTQERYNDLNGFIVYVNATSSYMTTNYSGIITCYHVQNYNFTRDLSGFRRLRRFYSFKDTVLAKKTNLKEQIDDVFGRENRNCSKKPDASIVDVYFGMFDDASTPGPDSGCQKEFLNTAIFVNRYAYVCYGKVVVTRQLYVQFYPGFYQAGLSNWNEIQASAIYREFTPIIDRNYRNKIDQYCQTPLDYCTDFFNTGCILPTKPNIGCTMPSSRSAHIGRTR